MSEQEKTEAVTTASEEQPAAEKESAAAESEQKPDTSEGEKPSETPKESEPAPQEAESATKETEGAAKETEGAAKETEGAAKETEPAAEEEEEPEEEEPDDGVPIVLVTGASGFIATHLIKQLLEQGRYRVRGTVRNRKKEEKVKPLRELVPDAKYPIRLVQADLTKPESWKKVVERCTFVFHVASPFPAGSANEAVLVRTAVEGTTNVLQACADAGTVKRVVVTSSIAAVSAGSVGNPDLPPDHVYTEKDWANEAVCTPYIKSKLKAEQAAWDFVKKLDESKQFELSVVNPGYVQGPLLSASSGEGTKEFGQRLLNGKMPGLPDISVAIVDVRDVAAAHIAAMEKSEAAGNRYILANRTLNFKEFAQIIANEFKPQGYKITTRNLPKMVMWVGKFFDSGVKQMYSSLGKHIELSNERMVNELGIQPRPVEQSIIDTCYSIVDFGLAKKTPGYLGHPSTRPPPPEPETPAAKEEGQAQPEEGDKPEGDKPEGGKPEGDKPEGDTPEGDTPEGDTPVEDKPEETQPGPQTSENKPAESEPSESQATSDEGQKTEEEKTTETSEAEPTPEETSESQPTAEESQPAAEETTKGDEETAESQPVGEETAESQGAGEESPAGGEESKAASEETSESKPPEEEEEKSEVASSEDKPAEGEPKDE